MYLSMGRWRVFFWIPVILFIAVSFMPIVVAWILAFVILVVRILTFIMFPTVAWHGRLLVYWLPWSQKRGWSLLRPVIHWSLGSAVASASFTGAIGSSNNKFQRDRRRRSSLFECDRYQQYFHPKRQAYSSSRHHLSFHSSMAA